MKINAFLTLIIMAGVFGILLPLLCSASIQSLGIFKQNTCIDLKQGCGNCTWNNITSIVQPNGTQIIYSPELSMTRRGTDFNSTFCTTSTVGKYIVNGYGDRNGNFEIWAYNFEVTPTGKELTISKSILYIIFLAFSFGLFLLCLLGALKIPFKNVYNEEGRIIGMNDLKYVKIFLYFLSYIILLFISGLLRGVTNYYIEEIGVYRFFDYFYWILLGFFYPILVVSVLFFFITLITDKKIQKALQRGIPMR